MNLYLGYETTVQTHKVDPEFVGCASLEQMEN